MARKKKEEQPQESQDEAPRTVAETESGHPPAEEEPRPLNESSTPLDISGEQNPPEARDAEQPAGHELPVIRKDVGVDSRAQLHRESLEQVDAVGEHEGLPLAPAGAQVGPEGERREVDTTNPYSVQESGLLAQPKRRAITTEESADEVPAPPTRTPSGR